MKNKFFNCFFRFFTTITVCAFCAPAIYAHAPRLSCYYSKDKLNIECEGGFSDGGSAKGTKINVMSYDDEVLWSGALNERSEIDFKRPEVDFYIRFEGGEGHTVEIDHSEID